VHPALRVRAWAERYPVVGPLVWLSTLQYFVVQLVAASAWKRSYSWRLNAISDLGATRCGQFDGRSVCSPLHGLMNASLLLLGLSMTVGSALVYQEVRRSRVGFALMGTAGVGAVLVGLFPEDTIYWAHITGADLAFLVSNIALIVFGLTLRLPNWFSWYTIASGAVALLALCLFLTHNRFFLGLGGMERVVAYPQTIWLIVFGLYMVRSRHRSAAHPSLRTSPEDVEHVSP
jgi:hypothetical membrane protein